MGGDQWVEARFSKLGFFDVDKKREERTRITKREEMLYDTKFF